MASYWIHAHIKDHESLMALASCLVRFWPDQFSLSFWNCACTRLTLRIVHATIIFTLLWSCTELYNSCLYLAMAIAASSITDSMAQDDIPNRKVTSASELKFPSAHLGKRKQCPIPFNLLGLASGNGLHYNKAKDVTPFN